MLYYVFIIIIRSKSMDCKKNALNKDRIFDLLNFMSIEINLFRSVFLLFKKKVGKF